jgi:hypothetical protein
VEAEARTDYGFSYTIGGTVSSPTNVEAEASDSKLSVPWDPEKRWLRGKKPTTQRNYKAYLKHFLAMNHMDPQGFLGWAAVQPKVLIVQEAMQSFADTQPESCRPLAMSALKTFLESNGYEKRLPAVKLDPEAQKTFHRGFKREEIILLLTFLDDPFEKLYVLFNKDAGFRARTTLAIKYHHIRPDLEAGQTFWHPYLEPKYFTGRKRAGITFIGPDTTTVIKELIRRGEIQTNNEECDPGKDVCECKPIFPFKYTSISDTLRLAMKKAGLDKKLQPSHGLRKFFENALDKPEPPLDDVKKAKIEGHTMGVRWFYRERDPEDLRPLYEQVYPYLSLSEEVVADRKMKAVLDELKAVKEENQRYKDMDARLQLIESQLAGTIQYVPRK